MFRSMKQGSRYMFLSMTLQDSRQTSRQALRQAASPSKICLSAYKATLQPGFKAAFQGLEDMF